MVGVMFVVLGLVPLGGSFALLRATVVAPSRSCPQCGGRERQAAGVLRKSQNPWLFHFCDWLFASLWGASREQQAVATGKCKYCGDPADTNLPSMFRCIHS